MIKLSRFLLVAFLLGLMSFVIVPVEYIHSLYNHEDSIDKLGNNQVATIEPGHLHCLILKTEFREFLITAKLQLVQTELKQKLLSICYNNPLISSGYSNNEQRGPPSC